jgi:CheY-like chemotaxis protein
MSKLILIADGDPDSLDLAQRALLQAGHVVFTASTGWKARGLFDAAHFDVVITDVFMPEMDGLELIHHVAEDARTVPIVALSGRDLLPIAGSFGADLILAKPILPSELRRAVAQVTANPSRSLLRSAKERAGELIKDQIWNQAHRGVLLQ